MFRLNYWLVLGGAAVGLSSCGPSKAEQLSRKVNEMMVAKIDGGEIKSEDDLAPTVVNVIQTAMKEMGFNAENRLSESDYKKLDEDMKKYEVEWKQRVRERSKPSGRLRGSETAGFLPETGQRAGNGGLRIM